MRTHLMRVNNHLKVKYILFRENIEIKIIRFI